jgi:acyl-[acyl-carrier-protein]-phospholipid O-acyltransferase/long-chain-fatty-acid--[acyl-carrier-protein] ligase
MFASLRFILCTGSHLPKSTLHNFRQKFGHIIHAGYGTSETTPLATINASDVLNPMDYSVQQGRKPNTEGLPLPGAAIRIVDPQSLEDLPQGTQGRILVGSSQIAKGYADPSFAVKTVEKDDIQWHITEDFGCLDEDGFLELANPEPISKRDTESDDT